MQVWSTLISLFVILLTAGCPYHTPLTEDHTIPIDKELLGYWYECDTNKYDIIESQAQKALGQSGLSKNKKTEGGVLVMPFSETEYVIRYLPSSGDGPVFLRGYPIEVGGVSCVQLQTIGPVSNRLYEVHWSTNLTTAFQPLETGIEYPINSCTDTVHATEDQCFYQVEVQLK